MGNKHNRFHDNPIMNLMGASTAAIESSASRLNMSPIDLAEALQDGGIAELVESLEASLVFNQDFEMSPRSRAILAKIRKEGE